MSGAKDGDTVKIRYKGTLEDGTVFDESLDEEPLEFVLGEGSIIPGFESAVQGMVPGDTRTVTIPPEEAYGPHFEEMIQVVDRSELPDEIEIDLGLQFQASQPGQRPLVLTVVDMDESTVTLDANHPLAGEALTFEIELLSID